MKKILILFFIVTSLAMADYLDAWDDSEDKKKYLDYNWRLNGLN